MKTTKSRVFVIATALLAVVCLIPSTFSWYTHNATETGNRMHIGKNDLPVSMKTDTDSITMQTYSVDDSGEVSSSPVSTFSANINSVQHYQTVFKNTGSDDVMVDLNGAGLGNDSDFYIGTEAPTLNEKCYASRAARTKKTGDTFRVYFKSNRAFYPYWTTYVSDTVSYSNLSNLVNDMNVAYKLSTDSNIHYSKLTICDNYADYSTTLSPSNHTTVKNMSDGTAKNNAIEAIKSAIDNSVFYADLPTNVEYFFFFNHYYSPDDKNKNWNSTVNITDFSQGKLYAMTGASDGNEYKIYEAQPTNKNLVALNNYYSDVTMSLGESVTADIGLKKNPDGDDDNFVPDYYGSSITYAVVTQTGDTSGLITVNRDGLIFPNTSTGTAHVKTTITGQYGDTKEFITTVNIPSSLDQVPIMKNIRIGKAGSLNSEGKPADEVVVEWYMKNNKKNNNNNNNSTMTLTSIFFTI